MIRTPEIPPVEPDSKTYTTVQAQFALKGFELRRSRVIGRDGATYVLRHWSQPRQFSQWHDVMGFLESLEGVTA
jgi:hypothetical protein